ncbi:MAG: hypothetical protein JWO42_1466, partial [Chloroflexi bacterium]|nr:hypothetical protein [Chloroflexota bacterium]
MSTRTLSRAALIEGARQALPLALSIFAYGLVFGVLAGQAGLSAPESLLMSMLVFAGSAQFVALGLWVAPLPVVPIVLTTLVVNVRHVLMGAALRPVLDDLPRRLAYASVFFMTDESWALTMSESAAGRGGSGFFIGSSLTMYVAWFSSTLVGRTLGGA